MDKMDKTLRLRVFTSEGEDIDVSADIVLMRCIMEYDTNGQDEYTFHGGYVGILPGHVPYRAVLKRQPIFFRSAERARTLNKTDDEFRISLRGGVVNVINNEVNIVTGFAAGPYQRLDRLQVKNIRGKVNIEQSGTYDMTAVDFSVAGDGIGFHAANANFQKGDLVWFHGMQHVIGGMTGAKVGARIANVYGNGRFGASMLDVEDCMYALELLARVPKDDKYFQPTNP